LGVRAPGTPAVRRAPVPRWVASVLCGDVVRAAGVVLAGSGGAVTPLSRLGGRPVLAWAVDALHASVADVIVVPWGDWIDDDAVRRALERVAPGLAVRVLARAPSRHAALHDALSTFDSRVETVVLHDSDRPLAPVAVVSRVVSAV